MLYFSAVWLKEDSGRRDSPRGPRSAPFSACPKTPRLRRLQVLALSPLISSARLTHQRSRVSTLRLRAIFFNYLCNELLPANVQLQSVRLAPLSQFVPLRTRRQQSKVFLIFDRL